LFKGGADEKEKEEYLCVELRGKLDRFQEFELLI
jgi:hypothetical protein